MEVVTGKVVQKWTESELRLVYTYKAFMPVFDTVYYLGLDTRRDVKVSPELYQEVMIGQIVSINTYEVENLIAASVAVVALVAVLLMLLSASIH